MSVFPMREGASTQPLHPTARSTHMQRQVEHNFICGSASTEKVARDKHLLAACCPQQHREAYTCVVRSSLAAVPSGSGPPTGAQASRRLRPKAAPPNALERPRRGPDSLVGEP
jgi:hypothetical protein